MVLELRIGSKGELFLPKALREELQLKSGDRVFVEQEKDKLIIRKIKDLAEFLELTPLTDVYTQEDIDKALQEAQNKQIRQSKEDLD